MANETLEFDAAGSAIDGTNPGSALVLMSASSNYYVTSASFPAPPASYQYASSVDTEGAIPVSVKHDNRTITLTVEPKDTASSNTHLDALRGKFAKIVRFGGTLKRVLKDGSTTRIYDLVAADEFNSSFDVRYEQGRPEVTMTFPAKPYSRGPEQDLGDNTETTLPVLVFTEASVPGDVPAYARLVIDNDDASNDQRWVTFGIESLNYSSSANAALFYEAEGRTALGGSATAAGPTGASGAGSNVMRNTALATAYQAILSTQATGGGAHLSHIGMFKVFARVQTPTTNTGTVSIALEWAEGDFRRSTQNATCTINAAWEGSWRLADLGLVSLPKVRSGTQRWEGRILAKSTVVGDDIDVDWLMLVPVAEGSGEVAATWRVQQPTSFSARDEFDQSAGALNAKTLPVGGTWAVSGGDATNVFTVDATDHTTERSNPGGPVDVDPTNGGSFAIAGATNYTATLTKIDVALPSGTVASATAHEVGAVARYVDANNWLMASIYNMTEFRVRKRVGGTITTIASIPFVPSAGAPYTILLAASATGSFAAWVYPSTGSPTTAAVAGHDTVLATSGTLDDGKSGFYDESGDIVAARVYDNFAVWTPAFDAAMFASQSLEIRSDGADREDSAGALWTPVSSYTGFYPVIPVSGAESRTLRVLVKASRSAPSEGPDSGTDDISARLFVTPRYLQ